MRVAPPDLAMKVKVAVPGEKMGNFTTAVAVAVGVAADILTDVGDTVHVLPEGPAHPNATTPLNPFTPVTVRVIAPLSVADTDATRVKSVTRTPTLADVLGLKFASPL